MSNNTRNVVCLIGSLISMAVIVGSTIYHQKKIEDAYNHTS